MKRRRLSVFAVAVSIFCLAQQSFAEPISPELMQQVKGAVAKGAEWLQKHQRPDGSWSEAGMPALTGLPLWALVASGLPAYQENVDKAVAFVVSKQNPDGGIYVDQSDKKGGGLGNYNTSICVTALHATGRRDLVPAILKARSYIASSQHFGADGHHGGFGYDKNHQRAYADLNNTTFSLDAMRRTQSVEDLRPATEKRADLNWEAALKYVEKLQNKTGETQGGFAYNTSDPKAGATTNRSGTVMLRAYGSMTYAGVLSMLHANLDRSDPRVRGAFGYASKFWSVDEHPGQGQQGLFFYFNIMSRALSAAAVDALPKASGGDIRWREEMIKKVISLQKPDGSWSNDNNRWWENDPVLATSYAMLALEFASGLTR
jgi:squalene-hopene/tetraprenyl-beta-curcumene cyclase